MRKLSAKYRTVPVLLSSLLLGCSEVKVYGRDINLEKEMQLGSSSINISKIFNGKSYDFVCVIDEFVSPHDAWSWHNRDKRYGDRYNFIDVLKDVPEGYGGIAAFSKDGRYDYKLFLQYKGIIANYGKGCTPYNGASLVKNSIGWNLTAGKKNG